jgi:hypothetical protein
MRAELLAELLAVARGEDAPKELVTPVTSVTPVSRPVTPVTQPATAKHRCRLNTPELQGLQALQVPKGEGVRCDCSLGSEPAAALAVADEATIEERAGLAAGYVPPCYLDDWAKFNHQKPARVSDAAWRLALDDGGRFLDRWGWRAAELGWRPSELFTARAGLIWRLCGDFVVAISADQVRLECGRVIFQQETRGFR